MGFLSFLLRKPSSHNDLALTAQSYDATVAANPPILGTYPVAGNGTNLLERLQQGQQPRINTAVVDSSAPPPIIPRLRNEHVDRPKTAPSKQTSGSTKRQGPLYRLPPKIWSTSSSELKPSSLIPPIPAFVQDRSPSICSSGSRGFVNLLDAQSEIKPPDFRSRVKATGAREYDEDVADRNLRVSRLNLNATGAQDKYTNGFSTTSTNIDDVLKGGQSRQPRKRHSLATGLRTESLVSSSQGVSSRMGSHHVLEPYTPSDRALGASTGNRRNSIPSFVAISSSTPRPRSSSKHTKLQELDIHTPNMTQRKAKDAYESNSDVATEATSSTKISRSSRNNRSAMKHPNDQVSELGLHRRHNKSGDSVTPWEESHESAKRTSRRQTMQYSPDSTFAAPLPNRQSLQAFHSPKGRDNLRDRTPRNVTSLDDSEPVDGVGSRHNIEAPPALRTPLFSNLDQTPPTSSGGRTDLDELVRRARARAQGIASPSIKDAKAPDIEEFVPERSSSLRNYSLTSETTSYSSLGSSSIRPQSRHTPNTSIDLTPTVPSFNFTNASQNTVFKANSSSPKGQVRRSTVVSSSVESTSTVHGREDRSVLDIDEYSSSDDSFENPHKPRGQNEKELLFVESGYGVNGAPFPGLPGLSDAAASRPTTSQSAQIRINAFHSPASSISGESDGESQPDFTPSYPTQLLEDMHSYRSNMFRESASSHAQRENDDFVQDESSDDEISFDIPRSRTSTMRYSSAPSQHRYETAGSPIDEEEDSEGDAVDIAALIRLRKEMEAKIRESGYAAVRRAQSVRRLSAMNAPVDDRSGYMSDDEK